MLKEPRNPSANILKKLANEIMNVNLYTDNSFSLTCNSLKLVNVTGPNSLVGYNSDITRCLNPC